MANKNDLNMSRIRRTMRRRKLSNRVEDTVWLADQVPALVAEIDRLTEEREAVDRVGVECVAGLRALSVEYGRLKADIKAEFGRLEQEIEELRNPEPGQPGGGS